MARRREYEIDDVLRRAMEVFWRKGYVATSLSDLYGATGLKPGNLYATFKDKETLFRRAFEAYAALFRATLPAGLSGRAAIEAWIDVQARLAMDDPERKGCLIVNTIAEREAHSPETHALAKARMDEIRTFFADNVDRAIRDGDLPPSTDVAVLADSLVGTVVALMMLGRAGADRSVIRNVADRAVATLADAIDRPVEPGRKADRQERAS